MPLTATITKALLRTKRVPVLEWPTASPDLSPIENIWRILKGNMAQHRPRNIQQLQDYLPQEWEKISTDTLSHLVSSIPKLLVAISAVKVTSPLGNRTERTFLTLVAQGNTLASFIITLSVLLTQMLLQCCIQRIKY
ncbi:hypothetical protein AVEN_231065-1 [Araneus ventricosus]|uniref:Tc1-like transposase DDE domain-containing protein n=1 Tax=Araneus ventricosus TaxID=182803 RepID=A0A4Y2A493_ARAVE|nr:hypothetical protein AVEN_231065-1 [Araneus ventricosus]